MNENNYVLHAKNGVVYRRSDGKMIVTTGFQGDFVVI